MAALVSYNSDSDESENSSEDPPDQQQPPSKRRKIHASPKELGHQRQSRSSKPDKASLINAFAASSMPPLPSSFHDLYATNTRASTSDDPSLHGGRKRQIPHVQGHWPSHVYLEWRPSPAQHAVLSRIVEAARSDITARSTSKASSSKQRDVEAQVHSLLQTSLSTPQPLHISLSRTLSIPTAQRDPFLSSLKSALSTQKLPFSTFTANFSSAAWFPNHEGNRWFLALQASRPPNDELNSLLRSCNETARELGYGLLYEGESSKGDDAVEGEADKSPSDETRNRSKFFHVSLAWALEGPEGGKERAGQKKQGDVHEGARVRLATDLRQEIEAMEVKFDSVKVKIGNAIHSISLGSAKRAQS